MAEQFRSITDARKELPTLAETVEGGGDRVVITNQGKPQAVLLGYDDFRGLLAAVEFLNRPDDLARLRRGLAETKRISFEELQALVEAGRAKQGTGAKRAREGSEAGIPPRRHESLPAWMNEQIQIAASRIEESARSAIADAVKSTRMAAAVRASSQARNRALSVARADTAKRARLAVNR